jgi:hypothetical protein
MRFKSHCSIALLVLLLCTVSLPAQNKKTGRTSKSPVSPAPVLASIVSEDEARMIVKGIPSVDIAATISRWRLQEPELDRLRRWADLLVEAPEGLGFQPRWSEFVTQMKGKTVQMRSQDVVSLVQMVLSRAYDSANEDLEKANQRVEFYGGMNKQVLDNLASARKLQGRLRSYSPEPWAGSLLPLPANQRSLNKCLIPNPQELKLSCQEVLVSTITELDDYIAQTETQFAESVRLAEQAAEDVRTLSDKRVQKLTALSDTAKMMVETASSILGIQ